MKIPFYKFENIHSPKVKEEIKESFASILDKSNFINGEEVAQFEKEFAEFSGAKYAIGVSNGLDALRMALLALGIGKDDEVIAPSNTYIATWLAATDIGCIIVPVEPRKDTYNINPDLIEAAITSKTKAIMPVHLYGQACEMDAIMEIAKKHNLFVIEDNAQSQGAIYNGKQTGGIGTVSGTSLYPGKNLGALGDGGIVTTNGEKLANEIRMIANYGSSVKYHHDIMGTNCRLDTIHAAALSIKLKYLNELNVQRQEIAKFYDLNLMLVDNLILPVIAEKATTVYHQYIIRTTKRDELQQYLADNGIGTLIHYPIPPHLQKCYAYLGYKKGDFPIAEEIAETCLSLPIFPGLKQEEMQYIVDKIKEFFS